MLTLQGCQTYYQFHGYNSLSQTELHGRFDKLRESCYSCDLIYTRYLIGSPFLNSVARGREL